MSPPISPTVKERVIQLNLEGKGRNEIAEILNLSHIRISQGSVTNILRTYKANTGIYVQTTPTSEMKEPLSIEDAKGSEERKDHDYSKEAPFLAPDPEQGEAQAEIPIPVPAFLDKLGKEWHYGMSIGKTNNTNMNGGGNGVFNLKDFKLDDKLNCVV